MVKQVRTEAEGQCSNESFISDAKISLIFCIGEQRCLNGRTTVSNTRKYFSDGKTKTKSIMFSLQKEALENSRITLTFVLEDYHNCFTGP